MHLSMPFCAEPPRSRLGIGKTAMHSRRQAAVVDVTIVTAGTSAELWSCMETLRHFELKASNPSSPPCDTTVLLVLLVHIVKALAKRKSRSSSHSVSVHPRHESGPHSRTLPSTYAAPHINGVSRTDIASSGLSSSLKACLDCEPISAASRRALCKLCKLPRGRSEPRHKFTMLVGTAMGPSHTLIS